MDTLNGLYNKNENTISIENGSKYWAMPDEDTTQFFTRIKKSVLEDLRSTLTIQSDN